MNQCTNTRAASLERCKRMPAPLLRALSPSSFLDLLHFPEWLLFFFSLSFSLSNCYLSLIFTITVMFTSDFSLTNVFFSSTPLLDYPSPVLLSYLFILFFVHFILWSSIVLRSLLPSFLFSAYSSFPGLFPHSLSSLIVFKEWKRKKKKCA